MMKRIRSNNITIKMATICIALVIAFGAVGLVIATPSPNGPGQPGAPGTTCGGTTPSGIVISDTPGNSAMSPGSPFNPAGTSGPNYAGSINNPTYPADLGGKGVGNPDHAISQYDIACFQVTQNSKGQTNDCLDCIDVIALVDSNDLSLNGPFFSDPLLSSP